VFSGVIAVSLSSVLERLAGMVSRYQRVFSHVGRRPWIGDRKILAMPWAYRGPDTEASDESGLDEYLGKIAAGLHRSITIGPSLRQQLNRESDIARQTAGCLGVSWVCLLTQPKRLPETTPNAGWLRPAN